MDLANPSLFVCAINEDSCDTQYGFWIPVDSVQTRFGAECFLCHGAETNQSSSSTSLTKPHQDPTAAQEEGKTAPVGLIGYIFVAAGMLVLGLGLMSWFIRREKRLRRELHDVRLELQDSHQFRDDDPANDFAPGTKEII